MCVVNSVSVYFESAAAVHVTGGHRAVLCVVLEGVPVGGMTQDLSVSTQILDDTAGNSIRCVAECTTT